MTNHSSRYHRPDKPPPLALTARDRAVIASVYEHRYLTAEHLHQLVFPGVVLRRAQERLRRLWSHRFLDRHYIPFILDGEHPPPVTAGRPIYCLARRGAAIIAAEREVALADVAHGFDDRGVGLPTLEHHLVVTDFLVALTVACRGRDDLVLDSIDHEAELWRRVAALKERGRYQTGYLVSDGAFTLHNPATGERATFHIEVVRANVKGGNERLAKKMKCYAELHHAGYFLHVFGHSQVRAILFVTTSPERAEHFRELAARLTHGRRLFWFGVYQARDERGREATSLTPETILSPRWQTTSGEPISFILSAAPPRPIVASAPNAHSNVCAPAPTTTPSVGSVDDPGGAAHPRGDHVQAPAPTVRAPAG